jgi:lysophospholipase L1-like esterase
MLGTLRAVARAARAVVGAIGVLASLGAAVIGLQVLRLRRMRFLPGHPGFWINHVVQPTAARRPLPGSASRALRMVFYGDSTTRGVGVWRAEDSLPLLLARRVADERRRPVHVVTYGWAGARAADLLRDQIPRSMRPLRASESQPFLPGADIVVIVIGANDATHSTPLAAFRASMRGALEEIGRQAPAAEIVLTGVPRLRGALRHLEPLVVLADSWGRLLARIGWQEANLAGVRFADLARRLRPMAADEALSSDRFHPSASGYGAWADVIAEALAERTEPALTSG